MRMSKTVSGVVDAPLTERDQRRLQLYNAYVAGFVAIMTLAIFPGLITVGFMEQLKLRRREYKRVIEERPPAGALNPAAIEDIVRLGDRLGLPDEEASDFVADAVMRAAGEVADSPGTTRHL